MKNKLMLAIVALLGFASGAVVSRPTLILAQDGQKLAVKFENNQVRVLELRLKPGEGGRIPRSSPISAVRSYGLSG